MMYVRMCNVVKNKLLQLSPVLSTTPLALHTQTGLMSIHPFSLLWRAALLSAADPERTQFTKSRVLHLGPLAELIVTYLLHHNS